VVVPGVQVERRDGRVSTPTTAPDAWGWACNRARVCSSRQNQEVLLLVPNATDAPVFRTHSILVTVVLSPTASRHCLPGPVLQNGSGGGSSCPGSVPPRVDAGARPYLTGSTAASAAGSGPAASLAPDALYELERESRSLGCIVAVRGLASSSLPSPVPLVVTLLERQGGLLTQVWGGGCCRQPRARGDRTRRSFFSQGSLLL